MAKAVGEGSRRKPTPPRPKGKRVRPDQGISTALTFKKKRSR